MPKEIQSEYWLNCRDLRPTHPSNYDIRVHDIYSPDSPGIGGSGHVFDTMALEIEQLLSKVSFFLILFHFPLYHNNDKIHCVHVHA